MPRINVLEVRYAPSAEGPWGEWQALPREPDFISHENSVPHETIDDWDDEHHMTYVWREFRVVPYERVEVREGREVPTSHDGALREFLVRVGGCWFVWYYRFDLQSWANGGTLMRAPEEWRELPEVPK